MSQHQEYRPRASTVKVKNKKKDVIFFITSLLLFFSLGAVSMKMVSAYYANDQPVALALTETEQQVLAVEQENTSVYQEEEVATNITDQNESKSEEAVIFEEVENTVSNGSRIEEDKTETLESKIVVTPKPIENEQKLTKSPEVIVLHNVKPKETLFSITMKYFIGGEYQKKVAEFNGIIDPSLDIKAGMNIKIPDPQIRYHKVKNGDTLFSITKQYYRDGKYQQLLARYNGIVDPTSEVKIGMELKIPDRILLEDVQNKGYKIDVDKTKNILTVYDGTEVVKKFSVATGKDPSMTPEGVFNIINKVEKPWFNTRNIPGGDPANPLGSHWLGLNVPGTNGTIYGIHGTNNPNTIGDYDSLGCIRLRNEDVGWLFQHLPLKTPVHIY